MNVKSFILSSVLSYKHTKEAVREKEARRDKKKGKREKVKEVGRDNVKQREIWEGEREIEMYVKRND